MKFPDRRGAPPTFWKILENYGRKWKIIPIFAGKRFRSEIQAVPGGNPCSPKRKKKRQMVRFIGEYTVKLDDKGRLVLPAAFKSAMAGAGDMRLVIKKDIFEDCLEMYTCEEWEKQSEDVKSRIDFFDRRQASFWREYMRGRAIVEPDSKIGRISIPKTLLESIGVEKEVVFAGNDFKIEIWAKERYAGSVMSREEFTALAASLPEHRQSR